MYIAPFRKKKDKETKTVNNYYIRDDHSTENIDIKDSVLTRSKVGKGAPLAFCPHCGKELNFPVAPNFCPECGSQIKTPTENESSDPISNLPEVSG